MIKKSVIFTLLTCISAWAYAQSNIMNRGFDDLVLGITESQVENITGFSGTALTADEYYNQEVPGRKKENLPESRTGFDKCTLFNFIMPIPVTRVFYKDNKVVMIEVSSYPDFTRPICLDSKTAQGLKFWDSKETMEKIYGKTYRKDSSQDGKTDYYYYDTKGIGFALANNEVRIIYFY